MSFNSPLPDFNYNTNSNHHKNNNNKNNNNNQSNIIESNTSHNNNNNNKNNNNNNNTTNDDINHMNVHMEVKRPHSQNIIRTGYSPQVITTGTTGARPLSWLKPDDRNWCEEFQKLRESELSAPSEQIDRIRKLRHLVEDFASEATKIGTTIISELWLPFTKKTILPQTGTVGGIAGGEKYVQNGIFFKFPVDKKGLYGGDEFIMKSAGHEFLSLMELIDCRVRGLHFPLIVLVDYLGYRLVAESVLPLAHSANTETNASSLILGSADGGRTIYSGNDVMERAMKFVSKILNLQPHYVYNYDRTKKTLVYTALDVEGHIGTDGRMYIIDTARVFPPEAPLENEVKKKGSHLYKLLRPEFVKNNPTALCSDAFSSFNVCAMDRFEDDLKQATERLRKVLIPQFAKELDQNAAGFMSLVTMREKFPTFINNLHRKGINVRYLGALRSHCQNPVVCSFILTEMVARSVKNILRAFLRTLKQPDISLYNNTVVQYFNLIFGRKRNTLPFWTEMLKDSLSKRFHGALSREEAEASFDLRSRVQIIPLFQRLQDIFGLEFEPSLVDKFSVENGQISCKETIAITDLLAIKPIVKHMHRIAFEEAAVRQQAAQAEGSSELHSKLLELAEEKYEQCLLVKPDDYRALHNLGLSITTRAINFKGPETDRDKLFEQAASKFQKALELNPKDAHSYLLWGNMLQEQSATTNSAEKSQKYLQEACKKYQMSYQIDPHSFSLLYNWGSALLYSAEIAEGELGEKLLGEACKKFDMALKEKTDIKAKKNYAVALSRLSRLKQGNEADRLFKIAQKEFRECSKLDSQDYETYFNWGNALFRHARLKKDDKWQFTKLLEEASKRYLKVLALKEEYVDALYNWGKALDMQWDVNEMPEKEHQKLAMATYSYGQVFKNIALHHGDLLDLRHLVELSRSPHANLKLQSMHLLAFISTNAPSPALRQSATHYMHDLGMKPPTAENAAPSSRSSLENGRVPLASIVKRLYGSDLARAANLEGLTKIEAAVGSNIHAFSMVDPDEFADLTFSSATDLGRSSGLAPHRKGKYLDESEEEEDDDDDDESEEDEDSDLDKSDDEEESDN